MKIWFVTVGLIAASACQSPKGFSEKALDHRPLEEDEVASADDIPSDAFSLLEATVEGDSLRVHLEYGGGCADHEFQLFQAGPTLRSMPPKQPLRLIHQAHGDPCRALIREWRAFDVSAFQASPRGVTVLLLEDFQLPYSYD